MQGGKWAREGARDVRVGASRSSRTSCRRRSWRPCWSPSVFWVPCGGWTTRRARPGTWLAERGQEDEEVEGWWWDERAGRVRQSVEFPGLSKDEGVV